MPHEVIMPALGMAQDTGRLVAWLKAAGDAVSVGDTLFEVETDKATMEVEAQHNGFLTNVGAAAGDDVPVGQMIALISADAGDVAAASDDAPVQPPAAAPKGTDVIMPVLGMAQDSGLLVAWHKAPGDAVSADDVLFEVETDKSTMEVPAGADGFIAALLAEPGQDVPTGQTIAVISVEKPDAPFAQSAAKIPEALPAPAMVASPVPAAKQFTAPPRGDGRILASPKARRLAIEAGLDLGRLVSAGHPQPYHAADIAVLRSLPVAGSNAPSTAPAPFQITASAPCAGTDDFLAWMLNDGGITIAPARLWVSFAAGALRATSPDTGDLIVEIAPLGGLPTKLLNPDTTRLAHQIEATDQPVGLILRDLTDSAITGLRLGPIVAPTLTIARDGDSLRLALDFTADHLDDIAAIALISGFAARLSDPLHHLL
ncbi:MAG: pyruvate/2-oxoglutarate dehydrogenase complex dihydrolipoamide acyltransferase (E2) component [Paracoccaceae bacterium]|jgi:pyruvate/2-oxoglutarate dehydrogenase complex dihydrolipoamide acyltransferase (E2) component